MAKRPTRSQAEDSAAAAPKARRPGGRSAGSAAAVPDPGAIDTQAARAGVNDDAPADVDPGSRRAALAAESMASEPSEADIRMRAYQRYLERGGAHGMDFEDWLEAERELRGVKAQG